MLLTPIEDLMPRHAGKILEAAERYHPTMGRLFGVALDEGYEYTTNKMFDMVGKERSLDERTLPMSKDEWEASPYFREGIEWDEDMSEGRAKLWADEYDTRSIRKSIIEAGKAHYGMVGSAVNFFGQLLGNLPDPINLIPVGGGIIRGAGIAARVIKGSRVAALATKAGLPALGARVAESAAVSKLAQSQLGRLATSQTGQAIGYGMLEGAAGTALADLIVFPHLQDRGEEIGFADAAIDIAFGGILGGGLGLVGDVLGRRVLGLEEARKTRDAGRRGASVEDRVNALKAQELAVSQMLNDEAVDVAPVLAGTGSAERISQGALAEILARGEAVDVDFGPLRADYRDALNAIRSEEGVDLIQGDRLVIPGAVVEKLYNKRILRDGMTPNDLAKMLLDVFHLDADLAASSKYPHIQALIRLRNELAEIGFIGVNPKTGEAVVKSVYPKEKPRAISALGEKQSPGEARNLPSADAGKTASLPAPRLSALQGTERSIVRAAGDVNYSLEHHTQYPDPVKPSGQEPSGGVKQQEGAVAEISAEESQLIAMQEQGLIPEEYLGEYTEAYQLSEDVQKWAEVGDAVLGCVGRK